VTRLYFGSLACLGVSILIAIVGCGREAVPKAAGLSDMAMTPVSPAPPSRSALKELALHASTGRFVSLEDTANTGISSGGGVVTDPNRTIIYTANVQLAVEDFTGVPERVKELVAKAGGYVASSNLSGSTGSSRHGTWTIRVPVDRFDEFVSASKELGELISSGTSSSDVSEEYYDVEARIRNKTKEEERLLKLLEERPGKLEDVIAIERELSRVREELERMQGRMRLLQDLTSLTTVELSIKEIRGYEPPQTPTLATRVRRSFNESLAALQNTGEWLLLAVVGIAPWLSVALVFSAPLLVLVRRRGLKASDAPSNESARD
jgi:hypothetical protein